jgi:outer membrane protein OmpA-like peptidoglycan-associated protein
MHVLLLAVSSAWAQEAVSLEIVKAGQVGTSNPGLILKMNQDAAELSVKVDCGGSHAGHEGPARSGEVIKLELTPPVGTHACKGSLSGVFSDGTEGSMPLSFTVTMHRPMVMSLVPGTLDLKAHALAVTMDRASSKVEITASGPKGAQVGYGLAPGGGPANTPVHAEWGQTGGEVIKLHIRAFDTDGFWSELELVPWSYSIPHEDVVFATNSADIGSAEEPKLRTAMDDARGVLDKYGADVVIKLYVGGHTDTVGDPSKNQTLSMARAKAIAAWFKKSGFPGQIYYQGYGEGDLAVETGDEVDEPKNRRATYVLAARPPEAGGGSGDYGWQELK